ncbi:MAG: AbrB/MazE/SpoVT family DNA-binding domain-containing protein [Bacillota bacterium]
MKNTGIIRPLDSLGRIVIPKELRNTMGIGIGSPMEFFSDGEKIVVQRFVGVACNFCCSVNHLNYYKNMYICTDCIDELQGRPSLRNSRPSLPKSNPKPIINDRKARISQAAMIEKLRSLIKKYPGYSQEFYADKLNISQSRVSQLKKML